jgi:hypothetical protein
MAAIESINKTRCQHIRLCSVALKRSATSLHPCGARQEQPETSNPATSDHRKIALQHQRPKPDAGPSAPQRTMLQSSPVHKPRGDSHNQEPHPPQHSPHYQKATCSSNPKPQQIKSSEEHRDIRVPCSKAPQSPMHCIFASTAFSILLISNDSCRKLSSFSQKRSHASLQTIFSTTAGMYIAF